MSIDFATLQGLTIPEGVVTQITDASGNVLWSAWRTSGNVILEVEKITSDTYANETTYTAEEFILFDIYPKSGGTVSVTYGGLTKTITDTSGAEEPNAQQVFFGTFNGVSDSVTTPASGELTIEGDYRGFGIGTYNEDKLIITWCTCITAINDFGTVEIVPGNAFGGSYGGCTKIAKVTIPSSVTSIGNYAFQRCTGLTSITIPSSVTSIGGAFSGCTGLTSIIVDSGNEYYSATNGILFNKDKTEICAHPTASGDYTIPSGVTSIGDRAFLECTGLTSVTIPSSVTTIGFAPFANCSSLASVTIPSSVTSIGTQSFQNCGSLTSITISSGVTSIGTYVFLGCAGLTSVSFANTTGWYVTKTEGATSGITVDVSDTANNVTLFTGTYDSYYWYRS